MLAPDTKDVIRIARTYAYKNGLSMTQFAKQADVSKSWLSRLHHGDGDLSLEYANKMLEAAGYKLIIKHQTQLNSSDTAPIDMIDDDTTLKQKDKRLFYEKPNDDSENDDEKEDNTKDNNATSSSNENDKNASSRLRRKIRR